MGRRKRINEGCEMPEGQKEEQLMAGIFYRLTLGKCSFLSQKSQ